MEPVNGLYRWYFDTVVYPDADAHAQAAVEGRDPPIPPTGISRGSNPWWRNAELSRDDGLHGDL